MCIYIYIVIIGTTVCVYEQVRVENSVTLEDFIQGPAALLFFFGGWGWGGVGGCTHRYYVFAVPSPPRTAATWDAWDHHDCRASTGIVSGGLQCSFIAFTQPIPTTSHSHIVTTYSGALYSLVSEYLVK